MPPTLPVGPYRTLTSVAGGGEFPYYIIPFDRDGHCEGPRTRDHLLSHIDGATDVFVFSHGWNNDWTAATERYESFISGFQRLVADNVLPMPAGFRPLLVGVFWPSQSLTWFSGEKGPDFATADPAEQDRAAAEERALIAEVASALPSDARQDFYALMGRDELGPDEGRTLARLLARAASGDNEAGQEPPPSEDDLLEAARSLTEEEPDYDSVGAVGGGAVSMDLRNAGIGDILGKLDPRNVVKPFTVWQMKDRAGRVGAHGAATLLRGLLEAGDRSARVHLIGHSFGCKVVMTAASMKQGLPRNIESALLLQPAVSQYAFAASVPERNVPGGFVPAIERVNRPILSTFSQNDTALTKLFHVAVRRHDDIGELQYAAGKFSTPSRYGALGGFGPQASGDSFDEIKDPLQAYDLAGSGRVIGIHGTRAIAGHGDISNRFTWWMLYSVATAHSRP